MGCRRKQKPLGEAGSNHTRVGEGSCRVSQAPERVQEWARMRGSALRVLLQDLSFRCRAAWHHRGSLEGTLSAAHIKRLSAAVRKVRKEKAVVAALSWGP